MTLPDNVTSISGGTFAGCSSLTSINIHSNIATIGAEAFAACGFTSIEIPNTVTKVDKFAFVNCINLQSVIVPTNVSSIEDSLFAGCVNLKSVEIVNVEESSLSVYSGYKTAVKGNDNVSIGDYAFDFCNSLTAVMMADNVVEIGQRAFRGCSNLSEVICLAEEPPTITNNSFENTPTNKTLKVKCDALENYKNSNWKLYFTNIICEECFTPIGITTSELTSAGATISWIGDAMSYEIQLDDGAVETVSEATKTYTDLTPLTEYTFKVRAVCGDGIFSEWTTTTFTTLKECNKPTVTISNLTQTEVTVTWNGEATSYEIQLDEGEVETISETTKAYTDLTPLTEYTFKVRAVCDEDLFSEWVNTTFTTLNDESGLNDAQQTIAITVYPNPMEINGNATINIQGLNGNAKLMVMDANGRVVINEDLNAGMETYEIKTSNLSSGVYYVAIKTQNGIATEKLIVK